MFVLGIESSCDETACAIVREGKEIYASIIASQHGLHEPYGGVFPELACRRHIEVLIPTIDAALRQAALAATAIDLIAVAHGPGLIGALLVGLSAAKGLAYAWNRPFIGVNHVEAHLYAAMMGQSAIPLPALGIVASGGHTFLARITELGIYELIGSTVDDAIGEAFDKVAALLGLPYPGGPAIEILAKEGDPLRYPFKGGTVKGRPWDFSFSGLKTNVLYAVKGQSSCKKGPTLISDTEKPHIAASFQRAAFEDLIGKSLRAAQAFNCRSLVFGGGVTSSQTLRQGFDAANTRSFPLYWPPSGLSLDNAAMIAGLGYHIFIKRGPDSLALQPQTRIRIG